ncbi:hypothetical protein [Geosporobacter ferrireducens]|uniref:Uncharacterized protein n=1 Tax=Geosporobacter ferrireducens TaxID=1424294 RepID=A0A1D8GCQ5_9FIRM|nr:hypothetical protein [Geosporobacter ferrireducens]AOT68676.1 hypothetical protein Gferi_03120 [Geosporobacter ferrireducens]MTI54153.1 hypothetical protein [Geosporobacter ferrireducens]
MVKKELKDYRNKSEGEVNISPLAKILQEQNQNIENIFFVEMLQEAVLCIGQYEHAQMMNRDIDVNIQEVHQKTIEVMYNLPELLINAERQIVINELRKQVIRHIKVLNAYYYECSYVHEILNDRLGLAAFEKKNLPKPDAEAFYQEVAAYLSKDVEKMSYRISNLLSVLPFRMTKQFFLDRVHAVLDEHRSRIPAHEWKNTLQSFEEQFYGKDCEGYGDGFPSVCDKIEALGKLEYKKLDEGQMQSIAKDTYQIMQNISRLCHTFQIYGRILNRIMLLKELHFKDLHREIGKGIRLQDVFEDFCNIITMKNVEENIKNISLEQLYESCRIQKDQLTKDMQQLGEYFNKVVEKENLLQNEDIQVFIKNSQKIIAISDDLNTVDIDKVVSLEDKSSILENDPAILKKFIEYMDALLKDMSGDFRRIRMRRLFTLIPIPFKSPEEFFEYVKSCIEFNTGNAEKNWIMNKVREQMKTE